MNSEYIYFTQSLKLADVKERIKTDVYSPNCHYKEYAYFRKITAIDRFSFYDLYNKFKIPVVHSKYNRVKLDDFLLGPLVVQNLSYSFITSRCSYILCYNY